MAVELLPLPNSTKTDAQSILLNQRATELNFKRLQATATGALTGTITSGYIPVANSASHFINSVISQSGTTITVTGKQVVTDVLTLTTGIMLGVGATIAAKDSGGVPRSLISMDTSVQIGGGQVGGAYFNGGGGAVLGQYSGAGVWTLGVAASTATNLVVQGAASVSDNLSAAGNFTLTGSAKNISFSHTSNHIISTANGNLTIRSTKSTPGSLILDAANSGESGASTILFQNEGVTKLTIDTTGTLVAGIGNAKIVGTDGSGYLTSLSTTGSFGSVMLSASPTTTGIFTGAIANFSGAITVNGAATNDQLEVLMAAGGNGTGISIAGPTVSGSGSQPALSFKRYSSGTLSTKAQIFSGYSSGDLAFYTGTGTSPAFAGRVSAAGNWMLGASGSGTDNGYALEVTGTTNLSGIVTCGSDLKLATAGKRLFFKNASNSSIGQGTLVGGTLTVNNTSVTANSHIIIMDEGGGVLANVGSLYEDKPNRVNGTSFVIKSANALDTSSFTYLIVEQN